jgi:hypothetical protein
VSRLFTRAALVALVVPFVLFQAAPATASEESDFVSRTNSARTSRGLAAYAVRGDLISVARRQASRMASSHTLYHNPNLGSEVGGWQAVGENVGEGGSVSSIQSAFMGSSSHRENILSTTYSEVGIGTAHSSDGMLWVSEVFRRPSGAVYTPPPPPRTTYTAPRTVTRRASRSGARRALPAVPARPVPHRALPLAVALPENNRVRLSAAWALYHRARPVSSFDHVVMYFRTAQLLGT